MAVGRGRDRGRDRGCGRDRDRDRDRGRGRDRDRVGIVHVMWICRERARIGRMRAGRPRSQAVAGGIVLVMWIRTLSPPTTTPPKGLDAPLMSPMTSRTGPKGRSETTFFDRFILRAVTLVTAR